MDNSKTYREPDDSTIRFSICNEGHSWASASDLAMGAEWLAESYLRSYKKAKIASVIGGAIGSAGVLIGLGALALSPLSPLVVASMATGGFSVAGFMRFMSGEDSCQEEVDFLRKHPGILCAIAHAVYENGLLPTAGVAGYEAMLREYKESGKILASAEIKGHLRSAANITIAGYNASDEVGNAIKNCEEYIPEAPKSEPRTIDLIEDGGDWAEEDEVPSYKRYAPKTLGGGASEAIGSSPVAMLNRTLAMEEPIGLPKDILGVMVDRPYSTFIFGMSSAGKDIALWNIMSALKKRNPTAFFLGIDGKNHPSESVLWEMYDETIRVSMLDHPKKYHGRLLAALEKAVNWPGRAFVTFSELNGVSGVYAAKGMAEEWRQIAHFIAFLALQGNGYDKFLYSTSQALNLDALGISKESRANCAFMAIANSTQYSFLSQIVGDTKVFQPSIILDQGAFQSACSRSSATQHLKSHDVIQGISYFHTALNRWEPMPRLENPGVDRGEVPANPIVQAIEAIEVMDEREAMLIAYRWFVGRVEADKTPDLEAFKNRARSEKRSEYLRMNPEDIYDRLLKLIQNYEG